MKFLGVMIDRFGVKADLEKVQTIQDFPHPKDKNWTQDHDALLKFCRYLLGTSFEIVSDHRALTFILNTPYHNARLMRWVLFVQEFDYDISHCKGADNVVADYFSRNFKDMATKSANQKNYLICMLGRKCVQVAASADGSRLIAKLYMRKELLNDLENLADQQASDEMKKCL